MWRIILGLAALLTGTMIYLTGRGESHPVTKLFMRIGLEEQVRSLSDWGSGLKWYDWVLYSLPDGLWMYSFMVLIMAVWDYKWKG